MVRNKNYRTLKKIITLRRGVLALLCFFMFSSAYGQDIHFSQFQGSPLVINPAFAGATDCDHCFTGQIRNQWNNVPVDYFTFAGSYDRKFYPKKEKAKYHWGGGLQFFHDIAGDSRMTSTSLALIGSYVRSINKRNQLSFGLQLMGTQRAFDLEDLTFDDQWEPYKDFLNTNSTEGFADLNILFGDVSLGGLWRYTKPKSRTQVYAGGAVYHLNRPRKSFDEAQEVRLKPRVAISGIGVFQLTKKVDLVGQVLGQFQGPHREIVLGGYGRLHLNQRPTKELALQLGFQLRAQDEINPAIGLLWKQWEAGFAYDVNISNFDEATLNNGGPEFYVKYCIKPAPELKPCPHCPKRL